MKPDRDVPRARAFCAVCDDHRALEGGETCPACHGMLGDPLRVADNGDDDAIAFAAACVMWILALVTIVIAIVVAVRA